MTIKAERTARENTRVCREERRRLVEGVVVVVVNVAVGVDIIDKFSRQ